MTTPLTPAQQAEAFREEIRELFKNLHINLVAEMENTRDEQRVEIAEIRADLAQMREGLTHASQPATPTSGTFAEMLIDTIIMTYSDDGKPAYKGLGAPFQKFGVRIWDEVLPQFADPTTLKPGKNAVTPARARVLMNTPEEGKTAQPRKVTGKA